MKCFRSVLLALVAWLCLQTNATNIFTVAFAKRNLTRVEVNETFTESTTNLPFRKCDNIVGLCISGRVTKQSDDYLVRVILKDKIGHKYCVLESYNIVQDSLSFSFTDYCEETALLDNIETDSIILIVHNAELKLDCISTVSETRPGASKNNTNTPKKDEIKRTQVVNIANKINAYNIDHRIFWGAGATPLALKSYEEKMSYLGLGDNESTEGFEYYCSGIFLSGSNTLSNGDRYPSCVSQFDWCNRHGRNWITGIRNQGNSSVRILLTNI